MKKVLIILVVSFLLVSVNMCLGQSWEWANPLPQGNTLNSVFFTDSMHGWAVGKYGTVLKYENGKWNVMPKLTTQNLNSVSFLNSSIGCIVGDSGTIFHYDGANWIAQNSPTNSDLNSVFYVDANNIWVAGGNYLHGNGVILKYDGNQWVIQQSFPDYTLNSICIINKNLGWVVGEENNSYFGVILKYDGKIWAKQLDTNSIVGAYNLKSVFFIDSTHVWATGNDLLRYDGKQWFVQDTVPYNSICMLDTNSGWAVGDNVAGPYIPPTGANIGWYNGKTWQEYNYDGPSFNLLNAVYFTDKNHGWAVGAFGIMLNYDGIKWTRQSVDSIAALTFYFPKPNHGWALGTTKSNPLDTRILKYDNGKWSFPDNNFINGGFGYFLDSNHVWSIGGEGIFKYNGKSWIQQSITASSGQLLSIYMADTTHGWVGCDNGILKYNGHQWNMDYSCNVCQIFSINGTDTNNVWADNLYYNGKQWEPQTFNLNPLSIYFLDKNHGWAVGRWGEISKYDGKIWTAQNSGTSNDLWSVFFTDTMHGWAVGENGTILKYNGTQWIHQISPFDGCVYQDINTRFFTVYFSDSLNGWISGTWYNPSYGTVLRTSSGGGIWTEIKEPKVQSSMFKVQCYPNPANQQTAISYQLSSKTFVNISIYDLIGNQVSSLINKEQEKGDYKIEFDAEKLNDGIYFCKLQAGGSSITKKIVVVH